ncbi:MAG TPA: adenylate/guanylate cyclase domain-containing protein [Nitrososphaera sp.]|nr:adenylate/guanylate cyclase domain-containing protein [Nitrososphaera sp.]
MSEALGSPGPTNYQRQTILNLHYSGIPAEIIALQMDIDQKEVDSVIEEAARQEQQSEAARQESEMSSLASFYLDALVDLEQAIKQAQQRVWKALKVETKFDLSTEDTHNVLAKLAKSKVRLVILNIDLVGSTRLSMTLPVDRLATLVQAFTQEMSLTINAYGGHVLKYVGDAILAFFVAEGDPYQPSINAINCARSMISIIREGINPILNQYDYPEMNVRIGIDVGENVVVQYGWNTHTVEGRQLRWPHYDILGYTINVAAKMTTIAKPDQIVIGQMVFDLLDDMQRSTFKLLQVNPDVWSYMSDQTGGIYKLYGTG